MIFRRVEGMKSQGDPLYNIFEHHLLNALVEEESTEEFLNRVVQEYMHRLSETGVILGEHRQTIEEDIRAEVVDMLRKKTYGHYSLNEFRKAHATPSIGEKAAAAATMVRARARRSRRAS